MLRCKVCAKTEVRRFELLPVVGLGFVLDYLTVLPRARALIPAYHYENVKVVVIMKFKALLVPLRQSAPCIQFVQMCGLYIL
jgi:hypothetical protein